MLVEPGHAEISLRRQCELLGLNRSGLYYQPAGESEENLELMRQMDEEFTRHPFFGSRRMTDWLVDQGSVNRKRVQRLMEVMGIEAVYPKPKLSQANVEVTRINQVWSTDITYIRMAGGLCTWWRSWIGTAGMC
jgi:putative transposase